MQKARLASRRSCRGCRNWAGASSTTFGSIAAGAQRNAELKRRYAAELIALNPDVIVTTGDSNIPPPVQVTRTVPIVFVLVLDPVGAGFAASLARPGSNARE
jgi:ABC-type uncharacterized transport system substrate-binding protein